MLSPRLFSGDDGLLLRRSIRVFTNHAIDEQRLESIDIDCVYDSQLGLPFD